jgi:hypothetical protein
MEILIIVIGILMMILGLALGMIQYNLHNRGIYKSDMRFSMSRINRLLEENKGNIKLEAELNLLKKIYTIFFSLFIVEVFLALIPLFKYMIRV